MALKSTIFKATVQLSDMDNNRYAEIPLTIAQHPSETDERMMVRLLAFLLNDHEGLEFGKGLSSDDEPAIWRKNYSDEILLWIDVGLPDKDRIRKASHKADTVRIYAYGTNNASVWWEQNASAIAKFGNVRVIQIAPEASAALAGMVERTMHLSCSIQDGSVLLSNDKGTVEISPVTLKP
ncbi:MAG: YaeQ family protein [Ketobacteraceae bacterium]|nr:YaeQ family protein [Ketobacteraceae bacterium]